MEWKPARMYFGADYNPEQWDRSVWAEDVAIMADMRVNLVTLGVFSWSVIEPQEDRFEFGWLDDVIELLHGAGIGIDLATGTASPPAWLTIKDPLVAAVRNDGIAYSHGGRQHYSASSRTYRERAEILVDQMASRYSSHPAVEMWHINNEYACHAPLCFGPEAEKAFRDWLRQKYQDIDDLNDAWQTRFWSQSYGSFDEVLPPRLTPPGTAPNSAHLLDFQRFSSHQWLGLLLLEKSAIRRHDSVRPITTNFMTMRHSTGVNYWEWVDDVDFVSTDHYAEAENPEKHIELAFEADITRGLARGRPWLLMEHSPSSVNWQPRNVPKTDGEIQRHAMSHVARGSSGAMFFQFRQSRGGSERFHAAMVPHAGTDSRISRQMKTLGSRLDEMSNLSGERTEPASVALIWDYESQWVTSQANLPTVDVNYFSSCFSFYRACFDLGVRVDVVSPTATREELSRYSLVAAPLLHLISDSLEEALIDYVHGGGGIVTTYFSAVSDLQSRVRLGGYGGRLVRDVCGVHVEEWAPLQRHETIELSNGYHGTVWSERTMTLSATALATFPSDYPVSGGAVAIARNTFGSGTAWYLGTELDRESYREWIQSICVARDISGEGGASLESVHRGGHTFLINHSADPATVGSWTVDPEAVRIIQRGE